MSTPSDAALTSTPSVVTPEPEVRTRYGRVVRAPVRYEPVEQVDDDYNSDDYDENESEVDSAVEFSDSELEDDDTDLDGFVVRDESDDDDNGSGSGSDSDTSDGVRPAVA